MKKLLWVIERDIRLFFQYKFLLIMRAIWFVSQIVLFGLIASRMINVPDYFRYYIAGLSVMTLYSASMFIGFDIYEEAEHGVFEYLLSLPVTRRQLVLGRSIGGGLRAFIYVGPLIAVSLYIIGAVTIKSSDRFDILMGVLDALIVRLSTAMYPLGFVQEANPLYGWIANFNPVTFAAELFRWGTGVEALISLNNPLLPLLGVIAFLSFFTFVGVILYDKRIEGGGWR
jgi:ABC-2 type transport system permease protein